jgi:hypothetical protein
VVVGVDEAREQHRTREVDDLGVRVRAQQLPAADGGDAVPVGHHHGRAGVCGVHGDDAASRERGAHHRATLAGVHSRASRANPTVHPSVIRV